MSDLVLREIRKEYVDSWVQWFNSEDTTRYMNKGIFPDTPERQLEFFERISKSPNDAQFAIVAMPLDLVGTIGIHGIDWVHRRGDVSVVIGTSPNSVKGYGTYSISLIARHGFEKMNLRKLTAGIWSNNIACIKAFEKNGFVLEGTLKENFHFKGSYVDELRYGLLRSDWERSERHRLYGMPVLDSDEERESVG